ncbi:hypothetical protein GCM10009678_31140 [Actinomadura kijaniata]|uniref:Uncharacterized protein n=1 Tax=Actinomadura namibiensis TaxID=182080 RepID=A0A7W3LPJ5_ACTNM|nr:hypothetical protein [Actinomadura namibiensis]MBA8951919.1 hypothetical protein [Actinomadura namibiensis]
MQRKLPELSTTQLIASGAATAAAAVGASYLGVYGTIIGAAFMSVVSTAGTAVAKHYLDQGREQIRERAHLGEAAEREEAARAAGERATDPDPTRTLVWPADLAGDPNATRLDPPAGGDPNATRLDGVPPETAVAGQVASGVAEGAVRRASWSAAAGATLDWARERWKVLVLSSAAVFALVIGGITVYESFTGAPIGNDRDQGNTLSHVFGGGSGERRTPDPVPTHERTGRSGQPSTAPTDAPTTRPGTGGNDGTQSPSTGRPTTRPTEQPTGRPTTSPSPTPSPSGSQGGQTPEGGQDGTDRDRPARGDRPAGDGG